MAVLEDVLNWSTERPAWQRDALRRIVTQDALTDRDITELTEICLNTHGVADPGVPLLAPDPLSEQQLPATADVLERVQLVALRDIEGVNALAPEQSMTFEPNGMTIIFGYNGSGKSGYARIIRALCRARGGREEILPDAFSTEEQRATSATVQYQVGDQIKEPPFRWRQGEEPPPELSQISFFDAECATVHVDEANELAFTPFGLDVLPRLARLCTTVGEVIDTMIREVERAQPAALSNVQAHGSTVVHEQLSQLQADSGIETFRQLATLTDVETSRIRELQEVIVGDARGRARELHGKASALSRLRQDLHQTATGLSRESIAGLEVTFQDAITKRTAATMAAEAAFGEQPLPGVGEDAWRELWEAARRYSEHRAYPDHDFPHVGSAAVCVLCQQPLGMEAKDRLSTFEGFVKADTEQLAERVEADLQDASSRIERLTVGLAGYRAYVRSVPDRIPALSRSTWQFLRDARTIQQTIAESLRTRTWCEPIPLSASPVAELSAAEQDLLTRAEELEQSTNDEHRQALVAEQRALAARQWLSGVLDDVEAEIARKQQVVALTAAKRDTGTTWITRKSSELTDKFVTEVLRERMTDEMRGLGAGYLRVHLDSAGGQVGEKKFRIALRDASSEVPVRRVLSEGEFRCVAIAGFLSELSTEDIASALVFDDPVSSLDHLYRRKVAERLVELAGDRQVIVFTHEISFLVELVKLCNSRVALRQAHVRRGANQPGECLDGVPWEAMKVRGRVGHLKQLLQDARGTQRSEGDGAYSIVARRIYGLLRETWEQAVEEVLLGGVVGRFQWDVHTQQLRDLHDITEEDIRSVNDGMTKASRFLEGHDTPAAGAEPVPDPDEVEQDIAGLEDWVSVVRQRRR